MINLGFRQKPKFLKISVGFVKFAKWYQSNKKPKWQDTQKSKKSSIAKITELAKLQFFKCKQDFDLGNPLYCNLPFVLIEILLYCIFYMYVNCVLTEHLAECERFKYFSKCKVAKSKIKTVLSSLFELPFLQTAFSSFYARCFCRFSCSEVCAGLGNGCERFCTLRSLLGSYVHQESI